MDRMEEVRHRGVPVLVVDYSGISDPDEAIRLIRASAEHIQAEPLDSVRVIVDVSGMRFNPTVAQEMKAAAVGNKPHMKAAAAVGLSGVMKVILRGVMAAMRQDVPVFDTREEALDRVASAP